MKSPSLFLIIILLMACQNNTRHIPYVKSWSDTDQTYLQEHLAASLTSVLNEIDDLDSEQWNWKQDESTWSIAQVIEHLIVHDELFYREARVLTGLPTFPAMEDSLFASDDAILSYREITTQNIGKSPSYMEPLGRWCSREDAVFAYSRVRNALITFVETFNKDLRKYYTSSGRGPTAYRDLHQLLLISVAHTQRHLQQIRNIKTNVDFSKKSGTEEPQ